MSKASKQKIILKTNFLKIGQIPIFEIIFGKELKRARKVILSSVIARTF